MGMLDLSDLLWQFELELLLLNGECNKLKE